MALVGSCHFLSVNRVTARYLFVRFDAFLV